MVETEIAGDGGRRTIPNSTMCWAVMQLILHIHRQLNLIIAWLLYLWSQDVCFISYTNTHIHTHTKNGFAWDTSKEHDKNPWSALFVRWSTDDLDLFQHHRYIRKLKQQTVLFIIKTDFCTAIQPYKIASLHEF